MITPAKLDLRHLQIFSMLLRFKSVSRVAREMSIPQPTVSRALAHLRNYFDDPLFVATRGGMEPTPHALSVAPAIQKVIDLLQTEIVRGANFDPLRSRRQFAIAASDTGHLLLLPRLMKQIEAQGSKVTLDAVPISEQHLLRQLETGEVDIAFGGFPNLFANIKERHLFKDYYVCLARRDHPAVGARLTKAKFLQLDHIVISARAMGHFHARIEKELIETISPDRIRLIIHNFVLGALIAEKTDAVLTVPSRVAVALGDRTTLKAFRPPLKLPGFDVKQYWHERFDREPANRWLRQIIAEMFKDKATEHLFEK